MNMDFFMLVFGCIFAAFAVVGLGMLLLLIRRERNSDNEG